MALPPDQEKQVSLVLSERCDLACRYCYLGERRPALEMSDEVVDQALAYLLGRRDLFPEPACAWTIGGCEPLLDIERVEAVFEQVLHRARELDHPWAERSRLCLTTNGLHYDSSAVQRFVGQFRERLEIKLSLDGVAAAHDRFRRDPLGRGTYDAVRAVVPRWLEQFPDGEAKITLVPETCDLLGASVHHLFELGIRHVQVEPILVDGWTAERAAVYEEQLDRVAEALVSEGLHPQYSCALFQPSLGQPLPRSDDRHCCSPGRQLIIDTEGQIYPCTRFLPMVAADRRTRSIGDVWHGLDRNRLRAFLALTRSALSPRECMTCEIASGCRWCPAYSYFETSPRTIYARDTSKCLVHRARARANQRFWERVGKPGARSREPGASN